VEMPYIRNRFWDLRTNPPVPPPSRAFTRKRNRHRQAGKQARAHAPSADIERAPNGRTVRGRPETITRVQENTRPSLLPPKHDNVYVFN